MLARVVVVGMSLLVLSGCPATGIVCREGTNRCGTGCADYATDRRNCGDCGQACASGQVCSDKKCVCQAGTELCDGRCVATASDPTACGRCGVVCAAGEVCEASQCRGACTLGVSTRCGNSCVDVSRDALNCGGCGQPCQGGQACVSGSCTSDVVVACFSSGQVRGVTAANLERAPLADVGTGPAALATMSGVLLSADGIDRSLVQAVVRPGAPTWAEVTGRSLRTGAVPNQLLVDGEFLYVVNAESGTLQVVRRGSADGDAGLPLSTVQELPFGANTYPQALAKVGSSVWVPLYGGYGASAADAGQRVVEVDVSSPASPRIVGDVSLKSLDLHAFDGGRPVARPFSATVSNGRVYVALNNFNGDCTPLCIPAGPGLLARIEPATKAVSVIDLGADACLNPQWVAPLGDGVAVACGGNAVYAGANYELVSVEKAGVVVLDGQDRRVAAWAPSRLTCDGGSCPLFLPGRFAVRGSTMFLGDQNAGRLAVLDFADGGLVERFVPTSSDRLAVCPLNSMSGIANVSDVLVP